MSKVSPVNVVLKTAIRDSFRVQQILGMFDLPPKDAGRLELAVELPPPDEAWTVGALVGPSGAGKTTVARRCFPPSPQPALWPPQRAIIDAFPRAPLRQLLALFSAVGLNSPPAWLRPFHLLSTGEQFRCNLARWLAGPCVSDTLTSVEARTDTLVIDEFTSHLDRDTARSCSFALQRFLRRQKMASLDLDTSKTCPARLIAVTCHEDILPWLSPDWVLRLPEGRLQRPPRAAPPFPVGYERCQRERWNLFRPHHYLSGKLARGATCYLAKWDERPAAFCAVLGQIGHAGRKRITRLVTLPQFQGLGLGLALAEHVCLLESQRGFRVSLATGHPAMIHACRRSHRWKFAGIKRCGGTPQQIGGRHLAGSAGRIVAAFDYLPHP